jgi:hypothetical protein
MRHRLQRNGVVADYPIDYFIGSGQNGRSYLVSIAGRLFQSPASYYSARRLWDVSPGYQGLEELDFERPVLPECLFCHSGRARPVRFTLNQYEAPPFESEGITCERCHGAAEDHLAKPSSRNIVNPAKLEARARDAVCEQCHLGGEARILNPGRDFSDYRPGEPLEDTASVYVFDRGGGGRPLKVISHVEQLAASRCAQQSGGRMWCGTCHDPHDKPQGGPEAYDQQCGSCHSAASLAKHSAPLGGCAGCHMPRRPVYDGGHTAFTDHQIPRRPPAEGPAQTAPANLRPWREPPAALAARNLGLAYISVGERDQDAAKMNEGYRLLAGIESQFADDPAVLTSLGAVLQRKNLPREAARRFARAGELEPRDARHRLNLAVALAEAGESAQAIRALEAAISLDPSLLDAYLLLAETYGNSGRQEMRRQTLERYLRFMPQSMIVRRLLRD